MPTLGFRRGSPHLSSLRDDKYIAIDISRFRQADALCSKTRFYDLSYPRDLCDRIVSARSHRIQGEHIFRPAIRLLRAYSWRGFCDDMRYDLICSYMPFSFTFWTFEP